MPDFIASSEGSQPSSLPQNTTSSPKVFTLLWITRYFTFFPLALTLLASIRTEVKPTAILSTFIPTHSPTALPAITATQNVQYQASLIRDYLPSYLDFVRTEVLPVMGRNIDDILYNLQGLTDIRPDFFYHAHIDYSIFVSGGINALTDMNNVILQYHTLENPPLHTRYWKKELENIHDPIINAWLKSANDDHQATSMSSASSDSPITDDEAARIASRWDEYLKQNMLPSPGLEMLKSLVYLIDGRKQPLYQEAFKNIYRFHSIAFNPEGYLFLGNRTHLENTFSPFQIKFERIEKCQELLPVFEAARAAGLDYIPNPKNVYVAQHPELLQNPEVVQLSQRLNSAIASLPDDNMIKISSTIVDQQLAFFAAGNYIFAVSGSLTSPSIFK